MTTSPTSIKAARGFRGCCYRRLYIKMHFLPISRNKTKISCTFGVCTMAIRRWSYGPVDNEKVKHFHTIYNLNWRDLKVAKSFFSPFYIFTLIPQQPLQFCLLSCKPWKCVTYKLMVNGDLRTINKIWFPADLERLLIFHTYLCFLSRCLPTWATITIIGELDEWKLIGFSICLMGI